jgi:hypothetical protein
MHLLAIAQGQAAHIHANIQEYHTSAEELLWKLPVGGSLNSEYS